jgi:hypothetical protein
LSLDFDNLQGFLNALTIDTKEKGAQVLGKALLGTQKRFLAEIRKGLEQDVHEFVTLKARQVGISTISLALDMYHAFKHAGTSGAIVVHEEGAREQFRAIMSTYIAGLPDEWSQDVVVDNKYQLVLGNRSVLQYKVAGVRETSAKTLGRSSALSFAHATEVAYWGDPAQIAGFKATMAEHNPDRFYHWETTANGFNHFERMWREAHDSVSVRPIFISWWSNEFYRVPKGSAKYAQYWGVKGRASAEERDVRRYVERTYGHELDDEQFAWYRWMRAEKITDEMEMRREYPTTPEEAFVASGTNFFTGASLTSAYKRVLGEGRPLACYRFQFGEEFTDTNVIEVPERSAHLKIWAEPVKGGFYTLGADPAYGSSEQADKFCISVDRCWGNRVEQVAELNVVDMSTYTFAWVICYLCGCYQPCVYNIEINGPGGAIIQEIDNLRRLAGRSYIPGQAKTMMDVVRKMQEFLYVKEDSLLGRPAGKHTLTTDRIKDSYLSMYRDAFERGVYQPHSRQLLDEMQSIVRDGGWIGASGNSKDDRVIAAALAYKAYNDQLRLKLIARNVVYKEDEKPSAPAKEGPDVGQMVDRAVKGYLVNLGYKRKQEAAGVKVYNVEQGRGSR